MTPVTVTSIDSATQLKVSGLGAGRAVPIGAVLFKPEMRDDILPTAETNGTAVTFTTAFTTGNGYSPAATVTHIRPARRTTITAIATDTLTVSAIGGGFVTGTALSLVSEPEQFVVSNVLSGTSLQLSGSILFSHRSGANVVKASQTTFNVSTPANLNTVMVGDTVVIEPDTSAVAPRSSLARLDRFSGTVAALNTATGAITLTSTQSGYYDFALLTTANLVSLGDAVSVSNFTDADGNTNDIQQGFRADLRGSQVR